MDSTSESIIENLSILCRNLPLGERVFYTATSIYLQYRAFLKENSTLEDQCTLLLPIGLVFLSSKIHSIHSPVMDLVERGYGYLTDGSSVYQVFAEEESSSGKGNTTSSLSFREKQNILTSVVDVILNLEIDLISQLRSVSVFDQANPTDLVLAYFDYYKTAERDAALRTRVSRLVYQAVEFLIDDDYDQDADDVSLSYTKAAVLILSAYLGGSDKIDPDKFRKACKRLFISNPDECRLVDCKEQCERFIEYINTSEHQEKHKED